MNIEIAGIAAHPSHPLMGGGEKKVSSKKSNFHHSKRPSVARVNDSMWPKEKLSHTTDYMTTTIDGYTGITRAVISLSSEFRSDALLCGVHEFEINTFPGATGDVYLTIKWIGLSVSRDQGFFALLGML